jgi:hypothetical protein
MNNTTLANITLPVMDVAKHALTANANFTTLNSTTTCALSPRARALSSVLTSFVGILFTGISSGFHVAFLVGWVCWFASLRNVLVGVYQVYSVFRLQLPEGGEHFFKFLDHFIYHDLRRWNDNFFRGAVVEQVSFLGWMGWLYTTLYSPIIQVVWLLENWDKASIGLKVVRALGVGVAALPSTFDTRARYGKALSRLCGWPAAWLFAALTAASTIIELGLAAKDMGKSAWVAALYVVFTLLWTYVSLAFASPHDEQKDLGGWRRILGGAAIGAFAGCIVATPAYGVLRAAQDHPGMGLSSYLRCEGAAWWQKLVAILP